MQVIIKIVGSKVTEKSSVDLPRLGLVVPSLADGGGVPAVARFIKDAVLDSGRYQLKLISLATASGDADSFCLLKPKTWHRGTVVSEGVWDGLPFVHVGAVCGEFEFQRYMARDVLARVTADCDVLQVVCGTPAWANAVCGLGKSVAVQCATRARVERRLRDLQPKGMGDWWRKAMTEITDRMDDRALRRVDAIQVENPWMLEYAKAINGVRRVDLRYAPPGVDTEAFQPLPQRPLAIDPYILCVARLSDPRKNIGLLLEAYAKLPLTVIDCVRLVLAGSSGPPDVFWQRADQLGLRERITYIPRPEREELISLYQRASVFALPSDEEGLGVVLLEAMACAVPVVATRCGGPDGIISNGKDGYLVDLDDAQSMSDCLQRLLLDDFLNQKMGIEARLTVENRYSKTVAGAAFLSMWDRLLTER
ncbi:MAG: glycosyltransferase family 4 protein [Betaproteobacteria bacterium]|nr:glycosyltransferase family 4 protein [Candidatus Dechloromonas phosphorivorans]